MSLGVWLPAYLSAALPSSSASSAFVLASAGPDSGCTPSVYTHLSLALLLCLKRLWFGLHWFHRRIANVLGLVLACKQHKHAHEQADAAGRPHAPLPAHGLGEAARDQRSQEAAQVVRNVPHAPVGAALRSGKPRREDACTAWPAHAL